MSGSRRLSVDINGPAVPRFSREEMTRFVGSVLAALRRRRLLPGALAEVSIALVNDSTMRRLNQQFRRKYRTTDVLTFGGDATMPAFFGEIVISLDQARRQAREQRHSLPTELRYLLLHGMIHALGYDHETDDGTMNAIELSLREAVGLE